MLRFITGRLIAMVLTMWAVSFVAFAIIQLPPGDYLTTYVATLSANGDRVDPAAIDALRQHFPKVLGPRQCGFQQPQIADAGRTAMLGDLLIMDGEGDRLRHPDPLGHSYFASSRRALRRRFMIARALSICCSKSGSYGVMR